MLFYSSVSGWVCLYTFKALKGDFKGIANLPYKGSRAFVTKEFYMVIGGTISPMVWHLIVVLVVSIIILPDSVYIRIAFLVYSAYRKTTGLNQWFLLT